MLQSLKVPKSGWPKRPGNSHSTLQLQLMIGNLSLIQAQVQVHLMFLHKLELGAKLTVMTVLVICSPIWNLKMLFQTQQCCNNTSSWPQHWQNQFQSRSVWRGSKSDLFHLNPNYESNISQNKAKHCVGSLAILILLQIQEKLTQSRQQHQCQCQLRKGLERAQAASTEMTVRQRLQRSIWLQWIFMPMCPLL